MHKQSANNGDESCFLYCGISVLRQGCRKEKSYLKAKLVLQLKNIYMFPLPVIFPATPHKCRQYNSTFKATKYNANQEAQEAAIFMGNITSFIGICFLIFFVDQL